MCNKLQKIEKKQIIENKLTKIMENFNNFFDNKKVNYLFLGLGMLIIFTCTALYFYYTPLVNEEVRVEVTNNLIPWEVKDGESFFKAMITRPFDLKITEEGQYRPRYLAFLVQFLDENLFLRITRLIPSFGNRQPFYILSIILSVISVYYFIITVWKKVPRGIALYLSSVVLLYQNFQVSIYWRARSAKLLTLSACVFLITYAIKLLNKKIEKKNIYRVIYSLPIFLLMTLDEQVLALMVMLTGLLFFYSILNKKINIGAIIYSLACFLYATFYLWWGKKIFLHFTGGLQKHGHTIEGSIQGLGIKTFKESIEILISSTPKIFAMSFTAFIVISIICILIILFNKNETISDRIKKIIVSAFILVSAIIILTLMIDAHSAIYNIHCLWYSIYTLVPTFIMLMFIIYLIANVKEKYIGLLSFMLIIGVGISLVYNLINVKNYYGAYYAEKGGFRDDYTDLIVTQDDIIINVYKASEMDIDNLSLKAMINTPFATNDVRSTKVIEGIDKDGNLTSDELVCYLIVQKARKLHFNIEFDDYTKYDSLCIIVNNIEVSNIPIETKILDNEMFIKTEINRAAYVKLIFNKKDGKKNVDNIIKLNELYTY